MKFHDDVHHLGLMLAFWWVNIYSSGCSLLICIYNY